MSKPNKIDSEKPLTISEQILQDGLKDSDPLVQQISTAMMTGDPHNALSGVVESF
ncbi:hypothetical protein KKD03_04190 [Patescibacteria group bacterium]|nr:hypothetical protein [Patescibacteria group bacterium]